MDLGYLAHVINGINLSTWSQIYYVHFQPIMLLFAWIDENSIVYALLIFQSILLSFPIYLFGKYYGSIAATAYVLYFPVWFNALFDFHFDSATPLILLYFFISLLRGRLFLACVFSVSLVFIKEVFLFQTIACGFYLIFFKQKNIDSNIRKITGLSMIVLGAVLFITIYKVLILQFFNIERLFTDESFSWMGDSFVDVLYNLFTIPISLFSEIVGTPKKIIYFALLFLPLAFIPLLSLRPILIAIPIILISLLSKNPEHYSYGAHYTAGIITPLIIAFSEGVRKVVRIFDRKKILNKVFIPILVLYMLFINYYISPSPISKIFWSEKIWSYSYKSYFLTERDEMIKSAISKHIPKDVSVVISFQNTINISSIFLRENILVFPEGVLTKAKSPNFEKNGWSSVKADIVVIDKKRPWFIYDKGCDWIYGKCTNARMANEYLGWVEKAKSIMKVVFEKDGFIILKRNNNGE